MKSDTYNLPSQPTANRLRVLHVEDSPSDEALILRELRRSGHDVEYRRVDTAAAMDTALKQGTWDAILADWILPSFSGAAALAKLRDSGLDLPFIIVSGEIGEEVAVEAMRAGAHDYVPKDNLRRLVPALEREIREALARQARKRVEEEVAERARLAQLGADVGVALTRGGELKAVLQSCVEALVSQIEVSQTRIWTLNDSNVLVLQASAGTSTRLDGPDAQIPIGQTPIGLVATQRQAYVTDRAAVDPRFSDQEWAKGDDAVAFAGYPLIVGDHLVGVMAVFAHKPFSEFSRRALNAVANEIALAIEHRIAEMARQAEAEVAHALARLGQDLLAALAKPNWPARLCELTREILDCDFSITLLWQPEEDIYLPLAGDGVTQEEWEVVRTLRPPGHIFDRFAARISNQNVAQSKPAESEDLISRQFAAQLRLGTLLLMALRHGTDIVGFQIAGYHDPRVSFSPTQERIASGAAHLASLTLEHARTLQELERVNRLKSDFVAAISHELRTPLNIIIGYNDLLLGGGFGSLSSDQETALRGSQTSALNLQELVTMTLDLGRLESGQVPLDLEEVDLAEMVAEIDAETQGQQQKPGVSLGWKLGASLPRLFTDRLKVKMVLKNLIGNSLKFTDRGTIAVHVNAKNGGAEFQVTDTGIGIPEHMLSVIFELFRQVDPSITRRHGGVGLGLHIVRRFLDLLGGTVSVESVVGTGTTFRAWVPTLKRLDSGEPQTKEIL